MAYLNYLSHHGIKGQKWGVENGPPYPLNDVVKAIAYRGGELKDGRKAVGFTEKDVIKARKIVDRNIKSMTEEEIKEYKSRLLLEQEMNVILGKDTKSKFATDLKKNASQMVTDSLKTVGTKYLTNASSAAINAIVENAFGSDVAAMLSNAKSLYDLSSEKKSTVQTQLKNKLEADKNYNELIKNLPALSANLANVAKDEEVKKVLKDLILDAAENTRKK